MKAVIESGGKQYLVEQGKEFEVESLNVVSSKTVNFTPLLIVDKDLVKVGRPTLDDVKVVAEVIEATKKAPKVTAIRYKAKKRVHKLRGHRQQYTRLKMIKVA